MARISVISICLPTLLVASTIWSAEVVNRARPPQFGNDVTDVFFPDARQKLNGERQSESPTPSVANKAVPTQGERLAGDSEGFTWSRTISANTLESAVKSLAL